ncbi:hypothetical protein [Anaeromicropila herbilytica]|uniref:Uncharacterized protein n=1 Tax=Anaeromicropila herbilytica TaxID=2785025 RepID=A0A7R7ELI8_9FIRM|nr:hypothetical protein [Anaeromicropila herbilytica]BCN31014.1 hypothetical protein bsdtb5_23090 [Anaeromicropila herbilytica]
MKTTILQKEEIESFLLAITESEQYLSKEYLVHAIRKSFLHYLSDSRVKGFETPLFLRELIEYVDSRFEESNITASNMLDYMHCNDEHNWIMYYDSVFLRPPKKYSSNGVVECDRKLFMLVLTGFIFDYFRNDKIDIQEIIEREDLSYETNQYGLATVPGVIFKRDYFIFDNKAYLYSILTNTTVIEFADSMPGFAKVITEQIDTGDVLLRLDERLALPVNQAISYSTLNFEKFYGPQFHFSDSLLKKQKTIIVHIDKESCDKLLMVIKQDFDVKYQKKFLHIEIETLPFATGEESKTHFITTFLHGMFYPENDCFTHIDYTKNQYFLDDYVKKYSESTTDVPIDFYAKKELHYKIWCVENGSYSREVWYNLMIASLQGKYRKLLDEILV